MSIDKTCVSSVSPSLMAEAWMDGHMLGGSLCFPLQLLELEGWTGNTEA